MKYKKYLAILMSTMVIGTSVQAAVFAANGTTLTDVSSDQKPPEKPDGEAPDGEAPEKPDGEVPGGSGGEMPDGGAPDGPGGEKPDGEAPDGPGGMGGANTQTYDYSGELSGALTADGEDVTSDGETISASEVDQNAALAENGGSLTITNGTLTKTGDDDDGDRCNFYGINSIALAVGEDSTLTITDSTLEADSTGSNAIFATDNATVTASNDTIHTTADNSRGLDATYGGTITADNMDISTEGDHSATVATDRGGGTISLFNSTLNTQGSGSPLLYSTGDIQVDNITGTATGSQIAGMEGQNTIVIRSSELTSEMTERTASDPVANGVIIYQSTSGDAETSTGERANFTAVDSTLTSAITSGAMFYLTNTTAEVNLTNTILNFDSNAANLLQIEGNDSNNWGTAGSNGADVTFTASQENLSGNISVDTISSLDLYLLDSTGYTGAIQIKENDAAETENEDIITVNMDSTALWTVTGDSTVTNLNVAEGARITDAEGNTVEITVNGETVVEGSSAYTITVTGSYGVYTAE